MNEKNFKLAAALICEGHILQAEQSRHQREQLVTNLLAHRRLPVDGWDEDSIELFLRELSLMDSNNFAGAAGVGEREGRIWSSIVARRHFGLGHGVGRSGDIAAEQPKAAGSSLLQKLANYLALDALRIAGIKRCASCIVVPLATGMALSLVFTAMRQQRPAARYILWPRVDQKTCLKSILTSGCEPLVVQNVLSGDELHTDVDEMERLIGVHGADAIVCVVSTTSVFAPRAPDKVVEVAALCARLQIPHVVNNAYGVQASKTTHQLNEAMRVGRLDVFVQSTDKNFMVPVGGAVIASHDAKIVERIGGLYPGLCPMFFL
eukprot:TRINITY_DN360_c0_g1_i1.p1 TRINITY_DN360_c0_g1~~TRINITY_DN360_c0_g1_i1.p1  ORF type:complete len:320 (-),score=77.99 TRINITY_DN360_c0_g1_i1:1199-2158(-)